MTDQSSQDVQLAKLLIRLRGDTLRGIEHAVSIKAANLSVWLRGQAQVISATRIAFLLNHLGVYNQQLRSDVVHEWSCEGGIADVKEAFALLNITDLSLASLTVEEQLPDQPAKVYVLDLNAFKPSPLIRLKVWPGLFVSEPVESLEVGQQIFLQKDIMALPANTPSALRKSLKSNSHAYIRYCSNVFFEAESQKTIAKNCPPPDPWKELSKLLKPEDRELIAISLLKVLDAKKPLSELVKSIDAFANQPSTSDMI